MTDDEVELGRIHKTAPGFEDHGIFTFNLDIRFGGTGQGFGGICLGGPYTDYYIRRILEAVGVDSWEDLPGKVVWCRRKGTGFGSKIVAIEAPDFVGHEGECRIVDALPPEVVADNLRAMGRGRMTDWDGTRCPRCGAELQRHDDGAPGEAIMFCPNPDCEVRRIILWHGGTR